MFGSIREWISKAKYKSKRIKDIENVNLYQFAESGNSGHSFNDAVGQSDRFNTRKKHNNGQYEVRSEDKQENSPHNLPKVSRPDRHNNFCIYSSVKLETSLAGLTGLCLQPE